MGTAIFNCLSSNLLTKLTNSAQLFSSYPFIYSKKERLGRHSWDGKERTIRESNSRVKSRALSICVGYLKPDLLGSCQTSSSGKSPPPLSSRSLRELSTGPKWVWFKRGLLNTFTNEDNTAAGSSSFQGSRVRLVIKCTRQVARARSLSRVNWWPRVPPVRRDGTGLQRDLKLKIDIYFGHILVLIWIHSRKDF